MLVYHPALDPYHSAFRMLRIMDYAGPTEHAWDRLRILDFYLAFPELIVNVRLPPKERGRKAQFLSKRNEYHFSGDAKIVFRQMVALQDAAIRLLISTGMIERTSEDVFTLVKEAVPQELLERIRVANEHDMQLISYVVDVLGSFPVHGKNGLKDRTGLMEFKYDPV